MPWNSLTRWRGPAEEFGGRASLPRLQHTCPGSGPKPAFPVRPIMKPPSAPPVTTAARTLDCARKVRIHYFLSVPITEAFLQAFEDLDVNVDRFSRYVVTAKDHVTIREGGAVHASGVMGENRFVVTYRKGEADHDGTIVAFERRITSGGSGPIQPA